MPAPDQRLIECRACKLGFEWVRYVDVQRPSGPVRPLPAAPEPPSGITARVDGDTLVIQMRASRQARVAMVVGVIVIGLAIIGVSVAVHFDVPFGAPLVGVVATALVAGLLCVWLGLISIALGGTVTVSPGWIRYAATSSSQGGFDPARWDWRQPRLPIDQLRQLAIARTRHVGDATTYFEVIARLEGRDALLVVTEEEELARYIEARIERHLGIVDDGLEIVRPSGSG